MTTLHPGSFFDVPTLKQLVFISHMELQGDTMGLFTFRIWLSINIHSHLTYCNFLANYDHC